MTGSRTNGTRAPDKCPDAGKGGMRGRGWINNNKVCIVLDSVQVVAFVIFFHFNKPEHDDAFREQFAALQETTTYISDFIFLLV